MIRSKLLPTLFLLSCIEAATTAAPMQSPVDINANNTVFANVPDVIFNYDSSVDLTLLNTGSPDRESTIRVIPPDGAETVTFDGLTYSLSQFHFHTESEHTFNGVHSDMELHLVNQVGSSTLVVGIMIDVGAFNALIDPIFSALPQTPGATGTVTGFNLAGLLPSSLESFRYDGSLTTPPFTEGVSWDLLAQPIFMSQAQIDEFRALFPDGDNRDVQDLNGRTILTDVPGFASTPEPSSLLLSGFGVIALLAIRRSKQRVRLMP